MKKRIVIMLIPLLRLMVYGTVVDMPAVPRSSDTRSSVSQNEESSHPEETESRDASGIQRGTYWGNENVELLRWKNIDFNPVNVKHTDYFKNPEEKPEEEWIDWFSKRINEFNPTDSPILIKESWTFDWDGKKAAMVLAK